MLKLALSFSIFLLILSCNSIEKLTDTQITNAKNQLSLLLEEAMQVNRIPRTVTKENKIRWCNQDFDWTEGFFPGTCWYLYEITNDNKWKIAAEKMQLQFEEHKYKTNNHDLGFIYNTSYGNGYSCNAYCPDSSTSNGCRQEWTIRKIQCWACIFV